MCACINEHSSAWGMPLMDIIYVLASIGFIFTDASLQQCSLLWFAEKAWKSERPLLIPPLCSHVILYHNTTLPGPEGPLLSWKKMPKPSVSPGPHWTQILPLFPSSYLYAHLQVLCCLASCSIWRAPAVSSFFSKPVWKLNHTFGVKSNWISLTFIDVFNISYFLRVF